MDTFEKKYNEAMLRADEAVQKGCLDKDMFDIIFPPEESEDERIRKWLYGYFSKIGGKNWIYPGITCEEVLAWLEKQKEQKEYHPLEDYSRGYNDGYYHGVTDKKREEQKPAEWSDYKDKIDIPYCSSEPEWSEEDEKMLDSYADEVTDWCGKFNPEYRDVIRATAYHFYCFRPSWKPGEEQMAWLKLAIDEAKEPLKSQLEELYKNIRENLIWK